ncbi:MAG: hypothetical protein ACRD0J_02475 [Acidimicrobiales bacterium]
MLAAVVAAGGVYLGTGGPAATPTASAHPGGASSPVTAKVDPGPKLSPKQAKVAFGGKAGSTAALEVSGMYSTKAGPGVPGLEHPPAHVILNPMAVTPAERTRVHPRTLPKAAAVPLTVVASPPSKGTPGKPVPPGALSAASMAPQARAAAQMALSLYTTKPWPRVSPLALPALTSSAKGRYQATLTDIKAEEKAGNLTFVPVAVDVVFIGNTSTGAWANNPGAGLLAVNVFVSAVRNGHPVPVPGFLAKGPLGSANFHTTRQKAQLYGALDTLVGYGMNTATNQVGIFRISSGEDAYPVANTPAGLRKAEQRLAQVGPAANRAPHWTYTIGSHP